MFRKNDKVKISANARRKYKLPETGVVYDVSTQGPEKLITVQFRDESWIDLHPRSLTKITEPQDVKVHPCMFSMTSF